jgi:polyhydroxybutyrate depolymerase
LLLCLFPAFAQEETPEATLEPEVTTEPDSTGEPEPTPEPEATAEATRQPNRAEFPGPGSYNVREDFGAELRSFIIDIPQSYSEDSDPMPLIFVLHGAGGTGNSMRSISGLFELGEEEGFISVFPSGTNGAWNDGRPDPGLTGIDDLGYFNHLINLLARSLNIDTERIYSTGYSMGGMMSYRIGCNLPDRIAAIASVASPMPIYILEECDAAPPLPVLLIQGTDDNVVPWFGIRGAYLSAVGTMEYWTEHNGCSYEPEPAIMPDVDPDDTTIVVSEAYDDCDAEVGMYGVYRGGHTWPGGGRVAPIDLGITSQDISGSEMIWAFFQRHALDDRHPLDDDE